MTDLSNANTWHTGAYRNGQRDPAPGGRNWIALAVFLSGLVGGFAVHELYKQRTGQKLADTWHSDHFATPSFQLNALSLTGLRQGTFVTRNSMRKQTWEWRIWGQTVSPARDFSIAVLSFNADNPFFHSPLASAMKNINRIKESRPKFGHRYTDLMTRHGIFRSVNMTITADGVSKLCIAFHRTSKTRNWYMKGWYCAENRKVPSPSHVACLIDKVILVSKDAGSGDLRSECRVSGKHAASGDGRVNAKDNSAT